MQDFRRVKMDKPNRPSAITGLVFAAAVVIAGIYGLGVWMRDLSKNGDERAIVGFAVALAMIGLAIALWELGGLLWKECSRLVK